MKNNYNISLTKKAEKFIKKQDKDTQKRIIRSIIELPEGDVKKLKGMNEVYRLRVGDFRVIFEKNENELIIVVIDIGNRGQIYTPKEDDEIYKLLKEYRKKVSTEESVKAFMVFNNQELDLIVESKPKNNEELIKIRGFGPKKIEKYGESILKIVNE